MCSDDFRSKEQNFTVNKGTKKSWHDRANFLIVPETDLNFQMFAGSEVSRL